MRTPDHVFVALLFCSLETLRQRAGAVLQGSAEARSHSSANCLGGLPSQPGSQRDLWIPQRRVRPGGVVGGRRSGHQPGSLGATTAALDLPTTDEPFAAIILCTADPEVDKRTRSKWSRVLRYSAGYKSHDELLAAFIRRKGGINKCAARFTRCVGRRKAECPTVSAMSAPK